MNARADSADSEYRSIGAASPRPTPAVVTDRHMDDVRPVGRLATDDERLRQLETDDLGAHLHGGRAYSESVATYAATSPASWPETSPAGIVPRPVATTASTSSAVSPLPRSAGPTPPVASAPWHPAQVAAKTDAPRAGVSRRAAAAAAGADGENGCHSASANDAAGDDEEQRERAAGLAHQNPNRTFVKYQRLDVSQSVVSTAASDPPSTGSTHGG